MFTHRILARVPKNKNPYGEKLVNVFLPNGMHIRTIHTSAFYESFSRQCESHTVVFTATLDMVRTYISCYITLYCHRNVIRHLYLGNDFWLSTTKLDAGIWLHALSLCVLCISLTLLLRYSFVLYVLLNVHGRFVKHCSSTTVTSQPRQGVSNH